MNRRVLIIGNTYYLKGVKVNMDNYREMQCN